MIRFIPSTVRQLGLCSNNVDDLDNLFVLNKERFAFQVELKLEARTWLNLNKSDSIPWEGLKKRYRLDIDSGGNFEHNICFEDHVLDDDKLYKRDRISNQEARYLSKGYHNLWVDMLALNPGRHQIKLCLYENEEYLEERLIFEKELNIEVSDMVFDFENVFYLDLWQHLSSIARKYDVGLYSDEHFEIIENYVRPLAEAGQKVCDLIVSDYSWGGQNCHKILDNPSSLYEYNLIKVYIERGQLHLNFDAMDRYINLCEKYSMADEINLFGILGNWKDKRFPNIVKDYDDPIRIRIYNRDRGTYSFIRDKELLKEYFTKIFYHLESLGLGDRVRVIADQPRDLDSVNMLEDFVSSCGKNIKFKYAINKMEFLEKYEGEVENFSIHFTEFLNLEKKIDTSRMTWYLCWKPFNLNQFIRSPLMESRLVGYISYLFDFKGFLRWNYCLWPDSDDYRYNSDKWAAGDMFFVYPGRADKPELSLRFKELVFGIQDYNFLKYCEKKIPRSEILGLVEKITGKKDEYTYNSDRNTINCGYKDDYVELNLLKKNLVERLSLKK